MFSKKLPALFILAAVLLAFSVHGASAGERCDLIFTNSLDEEIVAVRVRYETPYDEPRNSSSRINLPPQRDYRIGVQGTIRPERILVDLATATYDFADLSPLRPDRNMRLEIAHQDGAPILRRLDADGGVAAKGTEHAFLTVDNRPNAVDRDYLTGLGTLVEVVELVAETVESAREALGGSRRFEIEAGPIWNNDHALARCPEAAAQWNAAGGGEARWTGHWRTTVPGQMSVCVCVEGAADMSETLFRDDDDWSNALFFPVRWMEWVGVARVQTMRRDEPEKGVGFDLRFRLADADDVGEMLDELLSDLRVDGFRPWSFRMRTWDGEAEESRETDRAFVEGEGDKYDDQDEIQEQLFSAYADSSLAEAGIAWVTEEAFDAARAGGEIPAGQGVATMFSQGTFEALFVPDGRMFIPDSF